MTEIICDPESCSDMWMAAFRAYFKDCQLAVNGSQTPDAVSALVDLDGSLEQLGRLCDPMGIDVELAARTIDVALKAG